MSSLPSMRQLGERMDPLHPITRFGGKPTIGNDFSWYLVKSGTDAEKLYNTMLFSSEVGMYHKEDKELGSVHRMRPVDRQGNNPPFTRSLRQIAERHRQSEPVRFLFYNTWLIDPPDALIGGVFTPPDRSTRARDLARALKNSDYDIIALCEMFEDEDVDEVTGALPNYTRTLGPEQDLQKNSGLATYVRQGWKRRTKRQAFWNQGGLPDKFASKGILYTEIDVGPGCIDLFTTHLHAEESGTRNLQVDQLAYFIHENQKPENVTVVAGDFNIDGRTNEYERLLRKMALPKELNLSHGTDIIGVSDYDALDLQDVWLARGGPSGSTHTISNMEVVCRLDDATRSNGPVYCDEEYVYDRAHTESDDVPGYRLDYVFVEKPKDSHQLNIDIARVRRRPFWRSPADPTTFQSGDRPHFLSDHIGLDLTLFASPV